MDMPASCFTEEKSDAVKQEKQYKEQLEAVLENMPEAVIMVAKDGNYIMMNRTARELLVPNPRNRQECYDMFEYYDLDGRRLSIDDIPCSQIINNSAFTDKRFVIRIQGRQMYISANGTPILDRNGGFAAGVVCLRDITHEIEERQLSEKEMKLRFEFFSYIVHEFKTPLTVINAAVQALEIICGNELTDKSKGFIGRIKQNSLRQLRLVNNLLDIMKAEAGYLKNNLNTVDIVVATKVIIQSVMIHAEEKGVQVAFSSMIPGRLVSIDDEKYERILLNLLSNAIKFTPSGKRITVELSETNGMLCINVKDEGVGIPEEKQALIFDMFGQVDSSLTRKAEGTGIGLALVKQLVSFMGGEISVSSKDGTGSAFTVLLPVHQPSEEPAGEFSVVVADSRLIQAAAIEFSNIYL